MAEKGLLMTDLAGGSSIACHDAQELDGDSNARVIQRIDLTRGNLGNLFGTPTRSGVTVADGVDLDNLPTDLLNNLIPINDGSSLSIVAEIGDTNGTIYITPIVFDGDTPPTAVTFLPYTRLRANCDNNRFTRAGGTVWRTKMLITDNEDYERVPFGFAYIGLHITTLSSPGAGINVWGFVN